MGQRLKPRVTVTLDPDLLSAVDGYVREHESEGIDRSRVVTEALRLWYREQLREAMRRQFLAPSSAEERGEQEAWATIRNAASDDFVRRYDEHAGT